MSRMEDETGHQQWKKPPRSIAKREINREITGKLRFRKRACEEPQSQDGNVLSSELAQKKFRETRNPVRLGWLWADGIVLS